MSALIDGTFGCLDAAAETINARLGSSVSKGTLSKILSGQHQWPAVYIWALEDAASDAGVNVEDAVASFISEVGVLF